MLSIIHQTAIRASAKLTHHLRRATYVNQRPSLAPPDEQLVTDIEQEGVAVTSLASLSLPATPPLLRATQALSSTLPPTSLVQFAGTRRISSHSVSAPAWQIANDYPEIFLWGLQDRLLNIAESYIGLPVAYLGVNMRKDAPNHQQVGTRLWHRDGEDYRMLKIIVYLNDVRSDGGPFEYIPRQISPSYRSFRQQTNNILDADMRKVVPPAAWRACVGLAGTVIFVDTASVFHHGKIPNRDRLALIFAYASRRPKHPDLCQSHFAPEALQLFAHHLTERQRQAVFWRSPLPQAS